MNSPKPIIQNTTLSRRNFLKACVTGLVATLAGTGFIKNLNIDIIGKLAIKHHNIALNLKKTEKPFTIAVISDTHLNSDNAEIVQEAIRQINKINPDIVLVAGDILNFYGQGHNTLDVYDELQPLTMVAPGNHDYKYGELDPILTQYFKTRKNIQFLNNDVTTVDFGGGHINIVGTGSVLEGDFRMPNIPKGNKNFNILITHEPRGFDTTGQFDLCAAGHTHGADKFILESLKTIQNYPFTDNDIKYNKGLIIENSTILLTSNGIGSVDPEIKHGIRSSQATIDILHFS